MNTIKIFGNSPMPNQMVMSGIHASGGMGRNSSNRTPTVAANHLLQPNRTPKITPKKLAKPTAMPTRLRLSRIWIYRGYRPVGFSRISKKRCHTAAGLGKR